MCAQNQLYPTTYHSMVSAYGGGWTERLIALFTVYIDDSGSDPSQKVANATALVLPANRLAAFHSEWQTFSDKWKITDFHASECANANRRSDMAGWDDDQIQAAFRRIRQIIRRYGLKAISLSVNKADYDAVVPETLRPIMGQFHYTYAMHSLLAMLDNWASQTEVKHPVEYVFDWIDEKSQKIEKREVENALARAEKTRPGRFSGHYSFRNRKETPGLQCVDLLAWTCYREGLFSFFGGPPLTPLQSECLKEFAKYNDGGWLTSVGQTRQQIQAAVSSIQTRDPDLPIHVRPSIVGVP